MENLGDWEQKNLINELTQGKELAKQLQIHLNVASSSHEARELLVQNILKSYDKALSVLKWNGSVGSVAEPQPTGSLPIVAKSESPRSLSGSPHSDDSDRDFKDQENRLGSRKRKSMPRWTTEVQVCPGAGIEGPLDDGHNWRKYGQKDILGAKYPRGYYRCTYRNVQGCLATKQVQRSDVDPTIIETTYRGRHTCTHGSILTPISTSPPQLENQEPNTPQLDQTQQNQQNPQGTLLSFQTGLKVINHDLDNPKQSLSSFYYPSTSNFNPPMIVDNNNNNNLMGSFSSPTFVSPATSGGSHYFSPVNNNNINSFDYANFQNSESDLNEIVSAAAATSATNSPTFGLDFPFSPMDFDPNFTFDNSGFFP